MGWEPFCGMPGAAFEVLICRTSDKRCFPYKSLQISIRLLFFCCLLSITCCCLDILTNKVYSQEEDIEGNMLIPFFPQKDQPCGLQRSLLAEKKDNPPTV